mgnify:CR=1 FL=1
MNFYQVRRSQEMIKLARVLWIVPVLLIACSQDNMDGISVNQQNEALVPLTPLELNEHAGFDALDNFILANGANEQAMRIYEDISRLAPDNPLVLIRAAYAALIIDQSEVGPRLAASIIEKLKGEKLKGLADGALSETAKLDVMFVELTLVTKVATTSSGQLMLDKVSAPLAKQVLGRSSALVQAENWVGPHKATVQNAKEMFEALQSALDTLESRAAD